MNYVYAGQIFSCDLIDIIRQFLYPAHTRKDDYNNDHHNSEQSCHKARCNGGKRPALLMILMTAQTAVIGDFIRICSPIAASI